MKAFFTALLIGGVACMVLAVIGAFAFVGFIAAMHSWRSFSTGMYSDAVTLGIISLLMESTALIAASGILLAIASKQQGDRK